MNTAKIFRVLLVLSLSFTSPAYGQVSPSASKFGDNAREALIKALTAKLNAKSYRIRVEQVATVGQMHNTQMGDYVAPDRLRVIIEASLDGRSSKREMIVIGQQAYLKTPEGKWQKTQIDLQKLEFARLRDQILIDNLSKAEDSFVKFSGGVQDGMQAFVYEQTIEVEPKLVTRSKTTWWVRVADGLPHKEEIVADTDFYGKPLNLKSTTTYYDYNADIKIEAPL
jgi:hypothetical protein